MIDADFIIRYTNALYATPAEYAPRYDEFRDMLSSGQIRSKEWLVNELRKNYPDVGRCTVMIAGAWFGTLGMMLEKEFPEMTINMLDIDVRCAKYVENMIRDDPAIAYITADMYDYAYTEDVIINTNCEHISDLRKWMQMLPTNKIVVLQSNNSASIDGHINCVSSETDFEDKAGLTHIIYKGKLVLPMYTRYMIIGIT